MPVLFFGQSKSSFYMNQIKYKRVKTALSNFENSCQSVLKNKGYTNASDIVIKAIKEEKKLTLYFKKEGKLIEVDSWEICANSGVLGPKNAQGDMQVPEGFYKISVYNPTSSYHLSLGINYPNKYDQVRLGKNRNMGGDIFIHGQCVTIGCIPIENEGIEELYTYLLLMQTQMKKVVSVEIYPFELTQESIERHQTYNTEAKEHWNYMLKNKP